MAEIIIDMTGQVGLAKNFAGDSDVITPAHNLSNSVSDGAMAAGVFNPYLRNGYLAPSTDTSTTMTVDTPSTTQFGSVEYDHLNDDVYLADRVDSLYTLSSLVDSTIAYLDTFERTSVSKYRELHDLQIYQLNGIRKLFYVGKGFHNVSTITSADYPELLVGTIPTANDSVLGFISVRDAAGTKPTILASTRYFDAASSTTATSSFTVVSGTNRCLTVIVQYGAGTSVSGVTYGGVAMTLSGATVGTSGIATYHLAAPTVGTANVVATFSGATTNKLLYIIETDNTLQSGDIHDVVLSTETTVNLIANKVFRTIAPLNFVTAFSDEVITFDIKGSTSIYNTTNAYGSDGLFTVDSGMYLHVGYADLPTLTITDAQMTWLSGTPTGAFVLEVFTDYAFMRVADNGFAYLFADNVVHKIDGTEIGGSTGAVTKNTIVFPEYFLLTDAVDYRSHIFIAVHQYPVSVAETGLNNYTGRCGVYVWNRISNQQSNSDYIELPGVREIKKIYVSPDGNLKLITISDTGRVEIRKYGSGGAGGAAFSVVRELGIGAYPQFPDGLSTVGDKVVWLANDGKLYCEKGDVITILHQVKTPGTTSATVVNNITTGALLYGSGDEAASSGFRSNKQGITFSYLDGATPITEKIYPFDLTTGSNGAQTPNQGVFTWCKIVITSPFSQ